MIVKKIFSLIILLLIVENGVSANLKNSPDILFINNSAKITALGNVGIRKKSLLSNPAYIFNAKSFEVTAWHNIRINGYANESVSGIYPATIGNFGLNLSYFYQPTDTYINSSGVDTGTTLNKKDFSISAVYARKILSVISGVAFRYIHHTLAGYSANSFIFDFGIKRDYLLGGGKLLTGIGIKNIGYTSSFISEKYIIPFYIPIEFAYVLHHNIAEFTALTGINFYSTGEIFANFGTELSFFKRYTLRAGYRTGYDMLNLSLGLGINYRFNNIDFEFDYGIVVGNGLGSTHIFQLTAKFNGINTCEISEPEDIHRVNTDKILQSLKGDISKIETPIKIISAEASSSSPSVKPFNACDGNDSTRWDSIHKQDPQWIIFKLRFAQVISRIEIHWETAGAKEYDILVSEDNLSWTRVASINDGKGNETKVIKFSPVKAQYIKILGKSRVGEDWGYSIWEVRIYK